MSTIQRTIEPPPTRGRIADQEQHNVALYRWLYEVYRRLERAGLLDWNAINSGEGSIADLGGNAHNLLTARDAASVHPIEALAAVLADADKILRRNVDGEVVSGNAVPNNSALVTTDSSQTLTGKTLDGDDNTIQDLALAAIKTILANANKALRRNAAGAITDGNNIPNNSDLVTTDASQILIGKTVDGDDNNVQDLALTSLKAVFGDANKVLRRDGAGAVISGNSIPNSSALVTIDATQTLSGKTLTDLAVDGSKLILDYDIEIKLGSPATNDSGWEDILGHPNIRIPGGSDPTWAAYQGNIWQFRFSNVATNEMRFEFHIPHSYALGTDLYIHVHWSCNAIPTGNVKWSFELSYAKGHNQAAFPAAVSTSATQASSGMQYQHMLAEVVITDDGTSLIDRNGIEPDGIILVRLFRDPTDAADTLDQMPFLHYCDVHFQKSRFSTKNKSPNFYA